MIHRSNNDFPPALALQWLCNNGKEASNLGGGVGWGWVGGCMGYHTNLMMGCMGSWNFTPSTFFSIFSPIRVGKLFAREFRSSIWNGAPG